jgi:hypothetical protein
MGLNASFEILPAMSLPYKNIRDGHHRPKIPGALFGPLAGAKGSLCQH